MPLQRLIRSNPGQILDKNVKKNNHKISQEVSEGLGSQKYLALQNTAHKVLD